MFSGKAAGKRVAVAEPQPLCCGVNRRKERRRLRERAKDLAAAIRNAGACTEEISDRYYWPGLHLLIMRILSASSSGWRGALVVYCARAPHVLYCNVCTTVQHPREKA